MCKAKLLGISPYDGMKELMLNIAEQRSDIELSVYVGDLKEGVDIVADHLSAGIDCIISRGGTAKMIREQFPVPVTEIKLSVYDVLRAIRLAQTFSDQFAIVGYPAITDCAEPLCELLQYDMLVLSVRSPEDAQQRLEELRNNGYSVILGDMITVTCARQMGMNGILITSGVESIQAAIDQATQVSASYSLLKRRQNMLLALLENSGQTAYIYNKKGELLFSAPQEPDAGLSALLTRSIPTLLTNKEIKHTRRQGKELMEISGSVVQQNNETLCLFHVSRSRFPELLDESSVKLYHKQDAPSYTSFFGTGELIRKVVDEAELYAANSSIMLLAGEKGCEHDDFVFYIYRQSRSANTPLLVLDCASISNKKWDFLFSDKHSPLFARGYAIYFKDIGSLNMETKLNIRSYIEAGLYDGNYLFFSRYTIRSKTDTDPLFLYLRDSEACNSVSLPPLRARPDDIPSLSAYYINIYNTSLGKQVLGLSLEAAERMRTFGWPGNTSQLRKAIKELVIRATSSYIHVADVERVLSDDPWCSQAYTGIGLDLSRTLTDITRDIVERVLREENMNQSRAASRLGISRSTLWRMLK